MIKEIVVVEGIHDRQKIQSIYPEADCIVTNGSEISETTLGLIALANEQRGVILFLDPDFPGKKITAAILARIPNVKIAFLNKKAAISKNHKKVGVEHASEADIVAALGSLFETRTAPSVPVTMEELAALGLMNHDLAKQNRKTVCEALRLPLANGKTFWKLINMLDIPLRRIVEVMKP